MGRLICIPLLPKPCQSGANRVIIEKKGFWGVKKLNFSARAPGNLHDFGGAYNCLRNSGGRGVHAPVRLQALRTAGGPGFCPCGAPHVPIQERIPVGFCRVAVRATMKKRVRPDGFSSCVSSVSGGKWWVREGKEGVHAGITQAN